MARQRTTTSSTPRTIAESRVTGRNEPTQEQIRQRAFEIYILRGGRPGSPQEDWCRAERELREALNGKPS
ncbi:MAG: hypothetical protein CHACPFDD_01193 [Phycisphaerae bacterium]|nr:hypothetical protein [Phycisphaerae bacterium]